MKIRVVASLGGCEAASHESDLARNDFWGGAHDYFRKNAPGYGDPRLKLAPEKSLDRIEIFGGTALGDDHRLRRQS